MRSFRKPLAVRANVTTLYPTTNGIFSPDEKYILTGSGATVKGGKGKLLFLNREGLEVVKELEMDSSPVKVLWHPKINQVSFFFSVNASFVELLGVDCDGFSKWSNLGSLLADVLAKWSQTAAE